MGIVTFYGSTFAICNDCEKDFCLPGEETAGRARLTMRGWVASEGGDPVIYCNVCKLNHVVKVDPSNNAGSK